ncbi:MAG: acyltransferase [Rhizobiaceae bacterium]|nr:acyltransferase [Rhizobiaceae bacterium]
MTVLATRSPSNADQILRHAQATAVATRARMIGPDILRSLAILLVMLVHLPLNATPGILVGIREYGWLGVDIFFVLSGYLIGTQLFKEISRTGAVDFRSFYLRRAFRIFPAFFVVLALYASLPVLRDNPTMQPLWKFATFTVNLGFDPREGNAFSQAWTLAVEEQFYLVLPLLVVLLYKRVGTGWVLGLAGMLTLAGIALRYTIWDVQIGILVAEGQFRPAFATYLRDVYYPTYTRLDGLLFGVLLAAMRFFKPELCRQYLPLKVTLPAGLAFVVAALICFVIRGPLAGEGIFPVFQAQLGASLSYSLYLTHKSVFHVMRLFVGEESLQGGFGFAAYLIASVAVAAGLWFCVEQTFLRLRHRMLPATK